MGEESDSLESIGSKGRDSDGRASQITNHQPPPPPIPQQKPKQPGRLKKFWIWLAIDDLTLKLMFKSAVAPTVAIAMYQSDSVDTVYQNIGYLVAILSILCMPYNPRAIYIHKLCYQLVLVCFGCATSYFAIWTSIKAREHSGQPPGLYNSSQAAVCAAWLFIHMWFVNMVRGWRFELQFPGIMYSIFVIVALTYGSLFPDMEATIKYMNILLESFLTGFAISMVSSLFIFPVNCRLFVFKEMAGYLKLFRGILKAEGAYMQALETLEMPSGPLDIQSLNGQNAQSVATKLVPQAKMLKALCNKTYDLHGMLTDHLKYGRREVAYGKLNEYDLQDLYDGLRKALLPIAGMGSVIDIFERISEIQGWEDPNVNESDHMDPDQAHAMHDLNDVMASLRGPFTAVAGAMDEALHHVLLVLEFEKRPKQTSAGPDVEKRGESVNPGESGFAAVYEQKINGFYEGRHMTLKDWCEKHKIASPENTLDGLSDWSKGLAEREAVFSTKDLAQRQTFIILFMEYLMLSASRRILKLVKFADSKVADGTMAKKRLVYPSLKTLKLWAISWAIVGDGERFLDTISGHEDGMKDTYFGDAFNTKKDPEHLPPTNTIERLGDYIRQIPRFLRSEPSAFGFRAAVAVMSIGIMQYIHQTADFFNRQRLLWSLVMIGFSMSPTSGHSLFNYLLRGLGTTLAMIGSYGIWYMVNGHTAGVIVFMFIWLFIVFYQPVKSYKYMTVGVICAVSTVLILGYELQVKKLGKTRSEQTGQPAYPIWKLAPYRLLAVLGGLTVAYIWTIFPYPLSEHYALRKNLAGALYLTANYYSIVHETIGARFRGDFGNPSNSSSPVVRLEKARSEVFARSQTLLADMRESSDWTKWQVQIGGRYPKEVYDEIIQLNHYILNYTSLLSYASEIFAIKDTEVSRQQEEWLQHFRELLRITGTTTHEVTSLLSLLSNSLRHASPLPPYLKMPSPYKLIRELEAQDKDILDLKHISEPAYAAFAVIQIANSMIIMDLNKLTRRIKGLVGELGPSFHAVHI